MAAGMSQAAIDHARASRVAQVASGDFSESVLQREAADPAVARLALAHDPNASDDSYDRQLQALTDRLQAQGAHPGAIQQARDLDCMTDAVYYEARGETKRGQQAVAQVVMNRLKNPNFPKTVCGVVFQRASGTCQFSFACDGSMRHRREADAWDDARRVAARALSGYVLRDIGKATHFHTIDVSPDWAPRMLKVAKVGLHVFYKFNPHAYDQPPAVEHAVFTSSDKAQPTLRLAAAIVQKPEPQAAAAPPAGKEPKAVAKAPAAAQGLSKSDDVGEVRTQSAAAAASAS